jgi:uncharacterized protein YbjT (DUF2867 family)
MTRHPEGPHAAEMKRLGAEVVQGDFDDAASVERALRGTWGAFAVQNTWEAGVEREEVQGKLFAELARKAGVHHLVYASVASADKKTGIPHFDNKFRVEEVVRSLAFPSYVTLSRVLHGELAPASLLPGIQEDARYGDPAGDQAPDDRRARHREVRRRAFEHHAELNGRAIDIAGDEMTIPEAAKVLSRAVGHEVRFVQPRSRRSGNSARTTRSCSNGSIGSATVPTSRLGPPRAVSVPLHLPIDHHRELAAGAGHPLTITSKGKIDDASSDSGDVDVRHDPGCSDPGRGGQGGKATPSPPERRMPVKAATWERQRIRGFRSMPRESDLDGRDLLRDHAAGSSHDAAQG